jgi:hypothetical protein
MGQPVTDEGNSSGVGRRAILVVAVIAVMLVIGELGVRALDSRLPRALVWQSAEAEDKVDRMDTLAAAGGVDMVFVGSSLVNAGVDPKLFADDITAYNAALSAAVPQLTDPWTVDVVFPRLHPKVLVVGVSSFDFSDNASATAFYNAFAQSLGGREAIGADDVLDDADRWMHDHSALWAHKFDLRDPATTLDALRGKNPPDDPLVQQVEPTGHTIYKGHGAFNNRPDAGPPIGNWSVGTKNPGAHVALIAAAKAQGIKVVLVDMPVTDEYIARHPHGSEDFATYLDRLRELGASTGTPVLEFDSIRDHSLFADIVHLNATGATAFTPQLMAAIEATGVLSGTAN